MKTTIISLLLLAGSLFAYPIGHPMSPYRRSAPIYTHQPTHSPTITSGSDSVVTEETTANKTVGYLTLLLLVLLCLIGILVLMGWNKKDDY